MGWLECSSTLSSWNAQILGGWEVDLFSLCIGDFSQMTHLWGEYVIADLDAKEVTS